MGILRAAAVYFGLVFGAGFVLGTLRTIWITPRLGARIAELGESPVMLAVSVFAARLVVRWFAVPPNWSDRLGMGFLALGLMLVAEVALVLWLRGLSIREYFATRDRVSGTVYYVLLVVFALMPLLVERK